MSKSAKRVGSLVCLFVLFANPIAAGALTTVTGYVSINNSTETDFKTTEEFLFDMSGKLNSNSDHKEILNYDEKQKQSEDNVLNYLVKNNILSSDLSIEYDGVKVKTSVSDKFDFRAKNKVIKKSDFLATLGKAVYGVKKSRPLVFNTKSIRWVDGSEQMLYLTDYKPSGYNGKDDEFDFSSGDYSIFVTPNVYEMYFKELVSSGVVSLEEFSDTIFIDSYNNYGSVVSGLRVLPSWDDSLGYYDVLSTSDPNGYKIQSGSSVLGSGFEISKDGFNVNVKSKSNSWFFDEDLLTIDALTYVEKALRSNEKEMTKTEADIINYKYGVEYLEKIPSENRDTVKFLIAKGILNFEDEAEFKDLFKPLNSKFFRKLIYRVHKKDARVDFSTIQLTDSDNYWLSKGFSESSVSFYVGQAPSFDTQVSEINNSTASADTKSNPSIKNLFGLINSREKVIADKAKGKEYSVTRIFNITSNTYYYKGAELNGSTKVEGDITEINEDKVNKLLKVKFKVKANSEVAAVAILDANMMVKNKDKVVSVGTIPAMAHVTVGEGDSQKTTYFVSQTSLRNLTGLPIFVSEDKYLINKQTGAKALILDDHNKALIGNHVFNLDGTVVYGLNGEVYYNLDIIKYLLSEAMLSSLDYDSIFYTAGYSGNEKPIEVRNANGDVMENIYMRKLKSRADGSDANGEAPVTDKWFYDISQANSLGNYLIYDVSKEVGSEKPMNMIVELKYVLPNSEDIGIDSSFLSKYKEGKLTLSDVYSSLYARPTNSTLQKWWDSNLTFTNALFNYVMGTEGVKYVNSGYLMPSITVLGDLSEKSKNGTTCYEGLNNLFENSMGLQGSFITSVKSNTTRQLDFIKSYFNYQSNFFISTGDSALDGLIYSRNFRYLVGTEGKYEKSPGIYEPSNYTDYGDYVVLKTNGNVYHWLNGSSYFKPYSENSFIYLKDQAGLASQDYSNFIEGANYYVNKSKGSNKYVVMGNPSGKVLLYLTSPKTFYCDGTKLFEKSDYTGSFADTKAKFFDDEFGKDNWSKANKEQSALRPTGVKLKKGYYRFGTTYYEVKKDGAEPKEIKGSKLEGEKVKVYYAVKLDTNIFRADNETNYIKKTNNDPRLAMRNVTNVGIVSNIIESIVYNNSRYVKFSELPNKAKVVIGYNVFQKIGNALESPIVSGPSVSNLVGSNLTGPDMPESFKTLALGHLGNVPIYNKGFGSVNGQFSDYIKTIKFGKGREDDSFDRTIKLNSKGSLVVAGAILPEKYSPGIPINGFCYSMTLNDGLKFKEIGDSGRYVLVSFSNDRVDGAFSDTSYFVEDLSFSDAESLVAGLSATKYSPAAGLSDFTKNLLEAYDSQRIEDFTGLLSYLIRVICTWLVGSNTVLLVLRNDVLDSLVYEIKYPKSKKYGGVNLNSSRNKFSVDIYSILTFGLQNVDSKTSLLKGLVVSGVLFIIAALLSISYFG